MRALILWAEPGSTNLGVRVLAEGAEALARQAFGDVEVSHQGYGPGDAPVPLGSNRRMAARLVREDEVVDWLRTFDVVLDTRAGDSFADIYGLPRHRRMSLLHEAVLRAGVPVVLTPQTVGPFQTRQGRWLAQRTLRTSVLTMARDTRSMEVAQRLGARSPLLTTDVCFALPQPRVVRDVDVVVNVSGLLWQPNPHVDHERYQQVVRTLLERLELAGREVTLLAHVVDSPLVDNDVPVVTALGQELGLPVVVPTDVVEARTWLARARVAVGSRMHACLNALSVGTPAVPLAYSRKFKPLLDRIGWPGTVDLRADGDTVAEAMAMIDGSSERAAQEVREHARQDIDLAVAALARAV
ncbi:polysaccharide pyruvyl transferase family protein [Desertihabitans aurantiacus]|uniref:polysaccharide pyruvyl transferase family protein n=1 Tax=Desertihabitans aurantiacus TaxID=2282477 RepID=UPI000DF80676|nr:polysaccharide pyruvyl transferase family protein [Desertihabitans aurantiacus]